MRVYIIKEPEAVGQANPWTRFGAMTGGDEEHGPWRGHLRAVSLDILAKCVPMAVASQRHQSPDSKDAVTGQISRALLGPGTTCRPELMGNGSMQGSPQLRGRRRSGVMHGRRRCLGERRSR